MSEGVKIIAYVLSALFLGVILKELGFKGSRLVFIVAIISVIGVATAYVGRLAATFGELGEGIDVYASAMLKIIGVGYAFGVCSDICAELGEGGLAGAVCLFGRVEIMMICAPFIKGIVEKGVELI